MNNRDIVMCRGGFDLNQRAAECFIQLANEAAARTGRFSVALSGGSTPKALYTLLAAEKYRERIPWPKVHLFWGDERCVPPDHADRNYRMVRESLLSKINLPAENVHRMASEREPKLAAEEYEAQLKNFFQLAEGALPRFDLILLGLGEDGHTASLFPGTEALKENKRLVAANFVDKLNAHRLTLTLPVLNNAANILFLITGASKTAIVEELLGVTPRTANYPAAKILPRDGKLTWMITREAAGNL